MRIEIAQIIELLTYSDEPDRDLKLSADIYDNTALGSAVELGQHQSGYIHSLIEQPGLRDSVLTSSGIDNQ